MKKNIYIKSHVMLKAEQYPVMFENIAQNMLINHIYNSYNYVQQQFKIFGFGFILFGLNSV